MSTTGIAGIAIGHNAFTRGEYLRKTLANSARTRSCAWCGQRPARLYTYTWKPDDHNRAQVIYDTKIFCNLGCFKAS